MNRFAKMIRTFLLWSTRLLCNWKSVLGVRRWWRQTVRRELSFQASATGIYKSRIYSSNKQQRKRNHGQRRWQHWRSGGRYTTNDAWICFCRLLGLNCYAVSLRQGFRQAFFRTQALKHPKPVNLGIFKSSRWQRVLFRLRLQFCLKSHELR